MTLLLRRARAGRSAGPDVEQCHPRARRPARLLDGFRPAGRVHARRWARDVRPSEVPTMFNWRKHRRDALQPDNRQGTATEPRCSFCDKTGSSDLRLIAGPAAFICNECVDVCVDILVQDRGVREVPPAGSTGVDGLLHKSAQTCGFCGKLALPGRVLPIESRGVLCGECADAVEDALGRGRPRS